MNAMGDADAALSLLGEVKDGHEKRRNNNSIHRHGHSGGDTLDGGRSKISNARDDSNSNRHNRGRRDDRGPGGLGARKDVARGDRGDGRRSDGMSTSSSDAASYKHTADCLLEMSSCLQGLGRWAEAGACQDDSSPPLQHPRSVLHVHVHFFCSMPSSRLFYFLIFHD